MVFSALSVLLAFTTPLQAGQDPRGGFELVFDERVFREPFRGDVFVSFADSGEPRAAMHGWFNAPPVMRFTIDGVEPGASRSATIETAAAHAPMDWAEAGPKHWRVQAIARRSRTGRQAGLDEGDVFSPVVEVDYDASSKASARLVLSEVVPAKKFHETERIRLFEFKSPALSAFHGFDYVMRAGVHLPRDFGAEESYPVVYSVTGFGGTYEDIQGWAGRIQPGSTLDHCIFVVPDASNRYGHSVFCDSPSIGPWGKALVEELIPALEAEFNGAGPEQRYVTGVSSGGWSSLWLQVTYPEAFAGCWSHVPDPIDFHDFQGINLYDPLPDGTPRNMYFDERGQRRPLARRGEEVMLYCDDFARREHVLNPGGQIRSFEATFGAKGADGTPRRVFDVATGVIDHAAAAAWKPYDISNHLLSEWKSLRPRLAGKIHVYAGEVDTFYLEGAVERFLALAEPAGLLEDMHVEVVPGMAHALHGPGHADLERAIDSRRLAPAATGN